MAKRIPGASIGSRLREQRQSKLGTSVRDAAKQLDISPIHLSDIENGKRTPSEPLLLKLAKLYHLPESELRAGFERPEAIVAKVATENAVTAKKVPEFLRRAQGLSGEQWDRLIKLAEKFSEQKST